MTRGERNARDDAADVLINHARYCKNFCTHTALFGDEKWEITVRRADGMTPDEHIRALTAQCDALVKAAELAWVYLRHPGHNSSEAQELAARLLAALDAYKEANDDTHNKRVL